MLQQCVEVAEMHKTHRLILPAIVGALLAAALPLRSQAPSQRASQTQILELFSKYKLTDNVVKPPKGILQHPYLVPSGPYFQLFDWDMYFMAVALSYDHVGLPVANSVKDFLEYVNANANDRGYTPREIAPEGFWALPEMCKPFLAQAAVRASETTGDYSWIGPYYSRLADTLHFWEDSRRSSDGLFRWYNGVESGVDNNPAVSRRPDLVTEGVDLQCYLVREYRSMAVIARRLGKAQDSAAYQEQAAQLADRMRTKMWFAEDGTFYNLDSRTGKPVRIMTWTNFVPLWAGLATPPQAAAAVQRHLLNPREFWAPNGIRTLAPAEKLYDPDHGYWRGPVWVISNYIMMHGLLNYSYPAQAKELAQNTVALLVNDLQRTEGMNENYNPEKGTPNSGGHFLSWDLLAGHMMEEAETGHDPAEIPALK